MYIKEIYVEDANAPEFIQAMNLLEANIPCFVEHLGDNLIRVSVAVKTPELWNALLQNLFELMKLKLFQNF